MANTRRGRILDVIIVILFLIVSGLVVKGIYAKHKQLRELERESSLLDYKISKVQNSIDRIKQHIMIAKNDPYYLKHEAADRFLAVSKNETILIFNDNLSQSK